MEREAWTPPDEQEEQALRGDEPASLLRGNPDLAVLYAIASQLNRKTNVREILEGVLIQVTKLFGLQTGWVWLVDEERRPYLAASLALPPYLGEHHERMTGSCLCLDTFLAGDLAGAANIDVFRCSRLKNAEREGDPTSWGLRFHASVPIYAGETGLGMLNVASEDWRELSEAELQLLHIVGDQIGLAVQRARLAQEHMHAATRLATIEERNRLAREIHDTLAQGLAAITLQLETADALSTKRPERAQEAIRRALTLARANLEEARRSVSDLRAAPLQNRTLPEALGELARSFEQDTLTIQYRYTPSDFPPLSPRLETAIYRIAQEALSNISKHAQAEQATLLLSLAENELCLSVYDDGRGFLVDEVMETAARAKGQMGHFGLIGINERVKLLGGSLCIDSNPESGTCLAVCVPLDKDGRSDDSHFIS